MKVTRTSIITKIEHTLDLPITEEQFARFDAGALVQDAFPDLPRELREFLLTGITPEEWKKYVALPECGEEEC